MILESCPLCAANLHRYHDDDTRLYMHCPKCRLVHVPPGWQISEEEEHAEYLLHENDPEDSGYRRFLSRLADPLLERLPPGSHGLDFGCGPGPALAQMLREAGHTVDLYDHFFAQNKAVFERDYDFITASEVLEHLRDPRQELDRLRGLLRPGGILGVMTKLVRDRQSFTTWHYIRDPTHVSFFSRKTLDWLAEEWQADLSLHGNDVALFTMPS